MAIYIKGMEMPRDCTECALSYLDKFGYPRCCITRLIIAYGRTKGDCPLTEVPEPHGRLIDADACIDYIRNNNQHAWEALAYAPTIDAVEVVRCKDCFYLDEDEFENGDVVLFCNFMRAELNDMEMDGESYCSNGERREP